MGDNKKVIILLIGLLAFVMVIGRVSYSYFTYNKEVATATVESGSINIDFSNSNSNLSLSNLVPMSDSMGVISNNYVDFTVTGTVDTEKIYYEVYLLEKDGNTINPDYIKVYLTDQNDVKIRDIQIYSSLPDSEKQNGKRIYRDIVEPNSNGTEKTETKYFRLRMWLDENYTTTSSSVFASGIYLYAYNVNNDYSLPAGERLLKQIVNSNYITTAVNNAGIGGTGKVTYFVGSEDNINSNYVWYSGKLWRITAIYPDGTMKIITENPMTTIYYSNAHTSFDQSYADQWMNQEFLPTLYNYQNIIVQNAEWAIGGQGISTEDPYTLENNIILNKTVGLLNAYEYNNAGSSASNYLHIGQEWWLICKSAGNDRGVKVDSYGTLYDVSLNPVGIQGAIRPSIYLKSDVVFTNMDSVNAGKRNNPYLIKGDKKMGILGESINNRLSGEYVKIYDSNNNELLYRIVGIEDNKTKIVSTSYAENPNSTYSNKSFASYGQDMYFNTPSDSNKYWDNYLTDINNGWINTLSETTKNMLDTGVYYMGNYSDNSYSYKNTICAAGYTASDTISSCTKISDNSLIYTGKIGLLRAGEMMAAYQSPLQHFSTNSFDEDTVTITPRNSSGTMRFLLQNSFLEYRHYSQEFSVRPTLHLKSGVTITGGSGTANDPYTVTLNS